MIDLRAENRRLSAELAVARKKIGDLREEVARLRDSQAVQGVPEGYVLIPLSETDVQALCEVHGRPM